MVDPFAGLLANAGDAIVATSPNATGLRALGVHGCALAELLVRRNGFLAYAGALVVRPLSSALQPLGVAEWNAPDLWRDHYLSNRPEAVFFAEDLFGSQFCLLGDAIATFDPETGSFTNRWASLAEWARQVSADASSWTGLPLAQAWQERHVTLQAGQRLLPKKPFVLGGEFSVENLHAVSDIEGMRFRASIANRIHGLPDGSRVVMRDLRREEPQDQDRENFLQ